MPLPWPIQTVCGFESHIEKRSEPRVNPYPGTGMEARPWCPCGYSYISILSKALSLQTELFGYSLF
jgi:hypothetical protein